MSNYMDWKYVDDPEIVSYLESIKRDREEYIGNTTPTPVLDETTNRTPTPILET